MFNCIEFLFSAFQFLDLPEVHFYSHLLGLINSTVPRCRPEDQYRIVPVVVLDLMWTRLVLTCLFFTNIWAQPGVMGRRLCPEISIPPHSGEGRGELPGCKLCCAFSQFYLISEAFASPLLKRLLKGTWPFSTEKRNIILFISSCSIFQLIE